MKISPELLGSLPERLGWALLHSLWEGTIIAVVLAACLSLFRGRSAALRHALCLAAALAIPLCFALTLAASTPGPKAAPTIFEAQPRLGIALVRAGNTPLSPVNRVAEPISPALPANEAPTGKVTLHSPRIWKIQMDEWLPPISALWVAGVCMLSLRRLGGWRQIRRMRKTAAPARADLQQMLEQLQARFGLRRLVDLFESMEAATPMLVGLLRPIVVLPIQAATGLSASELEAVFAHELAHLVRHDAWSNLALVAAETVFFYHPAIWWISRRARDEREIAADDLALNVCQDRRVYADALCRLAEIRESTGLTLAATGGNLLDRIRRIVHPPAPEPIVGGWGAAFLAGAVLSCTIWAAHVQAQEAKVIVVHAGQPLQAAIDAATAGSTIQLEPGEWKERIVIAKPLTLEGADWEKSSIRPNEASTDKNEQLAVKIHDASDVVIRNLRISDAVEQKYAHVDGLIALHHAQATFEHCAIVGPAENGLRIADGSSAEVAQSLIAVLSNYGVIVEGAGPSSSGANRLHLLESDVRNVDVDGIVIGPGCDSTVIERCRISGNDVGISYDTASPTMTGSAVFKNRMGISALGTTRAALRDNLFFQNVTGVACRLGNSDTLESNTFVKDSSDAVSVDSGAKPHLTRNLFANCRRAVSATSITTRDGVHLEAGAPDLDGNAFWQSRLSVPGVAAKSGVLGKEPGFRDAAKLNFSLQPDSAALAANVGAAEPLPPTTGSWAALKEEDQFQARHADCSTRRIFEFEGEELVKVLKMLALEAKVSFAIDEKIERDTRLKLRLENVTPLQALEAIANQNHFDFEAVDDFLILRPGDGKKQSTLPPRFALGAISEKRSEPEARSLDFSGDDLSLILRTLGRQAGLNMVVDEHIIGAATLRLDHVTWIEAVRDVIALAQIEAEVKDKILYLKPRGRSAPPQALTTAEISTALAANLPADGARNFDFAGDDLDLVLRTLAHQANKALTVEAPVTGTVTLQLINLTPLAALKTIATSKGLSVIEDKDQLTIPAVASAKPATEK